MKHANASMIVNKNNLLLFLLMLLLSLLGLFFLYFVGNNQLQETYPPLQFFADSNTYIKVYRGDAENFTGALIGVSANYLGPLTILQILQGNNYLILLFNVCIFTGSVIHIAKLLKLNCFHIALLLLISPLTISSLLSVNKEIFLFPFLALALSAYLRKSFFMILIAFCISLLIRWQLGIFYVMLILIVKWRSVISSRVILLIGLLLAISVLYLAIRPIIEPILLYVQYSIDNYKEAGSGIFERVLQIQDSGLYFLVFPLKAFHLLFGMGFKIDKIIEPVELYNDFFVAGHCLVTFAMVVVLGLKRKLSLKSDFLFVAIIFLAFFCITPVFAPRYLYFVFVLTVLVLSGAPANLQNLQIKNR